MICACCSYNLLFASVVTVLCTKEMLLKHKLYFVINWSHQCMKISFGKEMCVCIMKAFSIPVQLVKSDADIFCLQGVWLPEHQQQIYKAVKGKYPYIESAVDLDQDVKCNKNPACDSTNLWKLLSCYETNCKNTFGLKFLQCSLMQCYDIFNLLSTECALCVRIAGRR